MHNRWCIISNARSGSNWLESGIHTKLLEQDLSAQRLEEFLLYNRARLKSIFLDKKNNLRVIDAKLCNIADKSELYSKMQHLISNGNKNQSIVGRIFIQPPEYDVETYQNFITFLIDNNFRIINLKRNIIDRVISLQVAYESRLWHRVIFAGRIQPIIIDKNKYIDVTHLDINTVVKWYRLTKVQDDAREEIMKNIPHIEIRYETLDQDIILHNIPFKINTNVTYLKTYDKPYKDLIINYDEVIGAVKDVR